MRKRTKTTTKRVVKDDLRTCVAVWGCIILLAIFGVGALTVNGVSKQIASLPVTTNTTCVVTNTCTCNPDNTNELYRVRITAPNDLVSKTFSAKSYKTTLSDGVTVEVTKE